MTEKAMTPEDAAVSMLEMVNGMDHAVNLVEDFKNEFISVINQQREQAVREYKASLANVETKDCGCAEWSRIMNVQKLCKEHSPGCPTYPVDGEEA